MRVAWTLTLELLFYLESSEGENNIHKRIVELINNFNKKTNGGIRS